MKEPANTRQCNQLDILKLTGGEQQMTAVGLGAAASVWAIRQAWGGQSRRIQVNLAAASGSPSRGE